MHEKDEVFRQRHFILLFSLRRKKLLFEKESESTLKIDIDSKRQKLKYWDASMKSCFWQQSTSTVVKHEKKKMFEITQNLVILILQPRITDKNKVWKVLKRSQTRVNAIFRKQRSALVIISGYDLRMNFDKIFNSFFLKKSNQSKLIL